VFGHVSTDACSELIMSAISAVRLLHNSSSSRGKSSRRKSSVFGFRTGGSVEIGNSCDNSDGYAAGAHSVCTVRPCCMGIQVQGFSEVSETRSGFLIVLISLRLLDEILEVGAAQSACLLENDLAALDDH
jgi:hypothetical protein